nr:TniQ family protein [Streptomyces griseochromogenes]
MAPPRGPRPCSTPLHRALPQQVRFINAESTGSFVRRLALANGLEFAGLLDLIGRGRKALPALGSAELYLNAPALSQLSVLTGCAPPRLAQALPAAQPERLLPGLRNYPAWRWFPQESGQQYLVRACPLCAAARGATQTVYVWSDMPWQVCLKHGTWQDNVRPEGAWRPSPEAMAWIARAHQRRRLFEQHLGQAGRALFADAHATCMYWNQQVVRLRGWRERQRQFTRMDESTPILQSLAIYPEAVELAKLFGRYERQRLTGTLDRILWWRQLAHRIEEWARPLRWGLVRNMLWQECGLNLPITAWIAHHDPYLRVHPKLYRITGPCSRALRRTRRVPSYGRHRAHADGFLPLDQLSCLPSPSSSEWNVNELGDWAQATGYQQLRSRALGMRLGF